MKSLVDIKKAIKELLPRERRDLLHYVASLITTAHSQMRTDPGSTQNAWPTEAESDLQYVIPELGYRLTETEPDENDNLSLENKQRDVE